MKAILLLPLSCFILIIAINFSMAQNRFTCIYMKAFYKQNMEKNPAWIVDSIRLSPLDYNCHDHISNKLVFRSQLVPPLWNITCDVNGSDSTFKIICSNSNVFSGYPYVVSTLGSHSDVVFFFDTLNKYYDDRVLHTSVNYKHLKINYSNMGFLVQLNDPIYFPHCQCAYLPRDWKYIKRKSHLF